MVKPIYTPFPNIGRHIQARMKHYLPKLESSGMRFYYNIYLIINSRKSTNLIQFYIWNELISKQAILRIRRISKKRRKRW